MSSRSQVVVVTGAASGLGLACAQRLVADGYGVVGFDRVAALSEIARGAAFASVIGDVRNAADRERLVAAARRESGSLTGVVNAAGVSPYVGALAEIPEGSWDLTFEVNVTGLFEVARACLPVMSEGGSIVNIASIGPRRAAHPVGVYSASKAAVLQLTRQMGYELGSRRIRVNAISPGIHDTPMAAGYLSDPEQRRALEAQIPLGRIGTPSDVAACAAFLLSNEAAYITGAEITVDGGWSL